MPPVTLDAPSHPVLTPQVEAIIDAAVQRLVTEFRPEQIWLFGSHAWGEPIADSDLDLVVVVSASDESALRRAQRAQMTIYGLPLAMDIMVPTLSEFERFRDVRTSLSHKIVTEGRLLYGPRNG